MKRWLAALALIALAACGGGGSISGEPATIEPIKAGWGAGLSEVVDWVGNQKSTGFVIIENNRIIVEKYWPLPDDAQTFRDTFVHGTASDGALLEDVASQQKSFIAILAGVAIDKGLLDIEKPVSHYIGAGWSRASAPQEAAITVRNLMEMNSGLKENLTYDAAPGTTFFYNTPAYAIMKPVLEAASSLPLDDLTQQWLARPAGMNDTAWRQRPPAFASVGNPTGLVTTPRDIARMGQLVLDHGVSANGARVISKTQLDALFARTSTNPSYGHLWWINGGSETITANGQQRAGQLIPSGPTDMVAALGAQDRKLYVVPSRKLIVVRTGQAAPDNLFDEHLWEQLTKVMPAR